MRTIYALFVLLVIASVSSATELRIALPTKGTVAVETPPRWRAQVGRARAELPLAVLANSVENYGFKVAITPFAHERGEHAPKNNIEAMVQSAAQAARSEAVGQSVTVQRFLAPGKTGYYFIATSASPEADGYKYLAEGAVQLGEAVVTFTVFANENHKVVIDETLQVLRALRISR